MRYATSAIDCPHCGRRAPFHGYRAKTIHTLGGPAECHRAYDYCGSCSEGWCPWDATVGRTDHRLSPAVEKLASLCGAVADRFGKGTDLPHQTTGYGWAKRPCSGADVWVAISDGGSGLEGGVRTYVRRVDAVILDFDHAPEYLAKLSRVCLQKFGRLRDSKKDP